MLLQGVMTKRIIHSLLTLLFFIWPFFNFAQQALIDSLNTVLAQKDLSDSTRILTMARLANSIPLTQIDEALRFNQEAITLAQKKDYKNGLSLAWSQQVLFEMIKHQKEKAEQALDSTLYYSKAASDLYKGIAYYRQGYLQNIENKPEEAIKNWQKAIPFLSGIEGNHYKSSIYYLLYGIHAEYEDLKETTKYAELSLESAQKSKSKDAQIMAWQINGTNNIDRFQRTNDSVYLGAAKYAFQRSIKLYKKSEESIKNPSAVALSALYLANFYLEYYPPQYKDSIVANVNLALKTSTEVGNLLMQANAYDIISKLNIRSGDLKAAEKALLTKKKLADSLPARNYYLEMNNYQSLASLEELKGDFANALSYYKKYIAAYQKVFDSEQTEVIKELETKYESEKKNKKLALLEQKNKFQKKQTYLYTGIAVILIIGLVFLFIAYRFRLKYALQREKLKTEETARLKAEQNLIEQEKEQLQKELLAGMLQIKRRTEMLKELRAQINSFGEHPQRELKKLIKEELKINDDFDQIRSEIKEIRPEFFKALQEQTSFKLTQSDLKYCAYFSLQLSTKQIARLLNVAPKSVRMAKYRLKQKLNLGKEDDFDQFLQSLS